MLLEVAKESARGWPEFDSLKSVGDAVEWFSDFQKREPLEKGRLLRCYLRDVKYGRGGLPYWHMYSKMADRAIRFWRLDEGVFKLRPSPRLFEGGVLRLKPNRYGYSNVVDPGPICGSVWFVVSTLFAWNEYYCSSSPTARALRDRGKPFDSWHWRKGRKRVKDFGCVYYMGSLHITSSESRYYDLVEVSEASLIF